MTRLMSIALFASFSFNFLTLIEAQPPLPCVTWNMQGATCAGDSKWTLVIQPMFLSTDRHIDLAALQETGRLPGRVQLAPVEGAPIETHVNGEPLVEYTWEIKPIRNFEENPDGNPIQLFIYYYYVAKRVSLAIVSRRRAHETFVFPPLVNSPTARTVIGIRIDNTYYFNMHGVP